MLHGFATQKHDMMTDDLHYDQFHAKYIGDFFIPSSIRPRQRQCPSDCDRCPSPEVQRTTGFDVVVRPPDSHEAADIKALRTISVIGWYDPEFSKVL